MNEFQRLRAIEFFAGVGGFATAAERVWHGMQLEIMPVDIDQDAKQVYELNHPPAHRFLTREIQSLSSETLRAFDADFWWLSPPCQPYSRRGQQRDIADPRAASLLHLIKQIECLRPRAIALENVVGFADSQAHELLPTVLQRCGYFVQQRLLCPTEMNWPNRRPRFYLIASLEPLREWAPLPSYTCSVAELIEGAAVEPGQCEVDESVMEKFSTGMDRVDPSLPDCRTACFGSSYGKSILHAGSYCRIGTGYRRFSPQEVSRLLGFPRTMWLPETMGYRRLWKLLGNSLSIPAVEYVLKQFDFCN